MNLTKSESNILEILLDANTPLSKSGIIEHSSSSKCWKDGSIHILLNDQYELYVNGKFSKTLNSTDIKTPKYSKYEIIERSQ